MVAALLLVVFSGELRPASDEQPRRLSLELGLGPHLSRFQSNDHGENRPLGIITDIGDGMAEAFRSPFHWRGKDWGKALAFAGGGALLYTVDDKIMSWVQKRKSGFTNAIATFAETFGSPPKMAAGIALVYGYHYIIKKNSKTLDTANLLLRCSIASLAVVKVIKVFAGRERPSHKKKQEKETKKKKKKHRNWNVMNFDNRYQSFPSGHSALAFSLATVISLQYKSKDKKVNAVGVISYTIATLTALSRVHDQKHWPSDIFIGAALGHFISRYLVKRYRREKENHAMETYLNGPRQQPGFGMRPFSFKDKAKRVRFFPILDLSGFGMSMNIQF
jgi:membrane-associated phospholipid phosphatase